MRSIKCRYCQYEASSAEEVTAHAMVHHAPRMTRLAKSDPEPRPRRRPNNVIYSHGEDRDRFDRPVPLDKIFV